MQQCSSCSLLWRWRKVQLHQHAKQVCCGAWRIRKSVAYQSLINILKQRTPAVFIRCLQVSLCLIVIRLIVLSDRREEKEEKPAVFHSHCSNRWNRLSLFFNYFFFGSSSSSSLVVQLCDNIKRQWVAHHIPFCLCLPMRISCPDLTSWIESSAACLRNRIITMKKLISVHPSTIKLHSSVQRIHFKHASITFSNDRAASPVFSITLRSSLLSSVVLFIAQS